MFVNQGTDTSVFRLCISAFQGGCFHRFSLKVSSRGAGTMTEALFLTFQSQLSVVMETVLKSAMFEITRLVEDSFLEEVGHHKQEVEVLKLRLQLSESKLREKEREREWEKERERGRRTQCPDCGRTGDSSSRDESQTVETAQGELQTGLKTDKTYLPYYRSLCGLGRAEEYPII